MPPPIEVVPGLGLGDLLGLLDFGDSKEDGGRTCIDDDEGVVKLGEIDAPALGLKKLVRRGAGALSQEDGG